MLHACHLCSPLGRHRLGICDSSQPSRNMSLCRNDDSPFERLRRAEQELDGSLEAEQVDSGPAPHTPPTSGLTPVLTLPVLSGFLRVGELGRFVAASQAAQQQPGQHEAIILLHISCFGIDFALPCCGALQAAVMFQTPQRTRASPARSDVCMDAARLQSQTPAGVLGNDTVAVGCSRSYFQDCAAASLASPASTRCVELQARLPLEFQTGSRIAGNHAATMLKRRC